jgi:hypothetical protein
LDESEGIRGDLEGDDDILGIVMKRYESQKGRLMRLNDMAKVKAEMTESGHSVFNPTCSTIYLYHRAGRTIKKKAQHGLS